MRSVPRALRAMLLTVVIGGVYAVSGAQPAEVLLGALTRAWSEIAPRSEASAEGAACGPDGCAI